MSREDLKPWNTFLGTEKFKNWSSVCLEKLQKIRQRTFFLVSTSVDFHLFTFSLHLNFWKCLRNMIQLHICRNTHWIEKFPPLDLCYVCEIKTLRKTSPYSVMKQECSKKAQLVKLASPSTIFNGRWSCFYKCKRLYSFYIYRCCGHFSVLSTYDKRYVKIYVTVQGSGCIFRMHI